MKSDAFRMIGALVAGAAAVGLSGALLLPAAGLCGLNPVGRGFPQVQAYGETLDNNVKSALCVACHTRTPAAQDNTVRGSHFVYLSAGSPTLQTQWERLTPWTLNGKDYSKYGATTANNMPQGVAGQMICESCHNVLYNVGKYKVLAVDNELSDPNALCEGCHTDTAMPAHLRHPMTGDPVATRGGALLLTTAGTVLSTPLDNATYPGPDRMNCRSCHRSHGSPTATGARILKRGVGAGVQGVGTVGAERQSDIDPTGTNRLVTDFTPLCASCHTE